MVGKAQVWAVAGSRQDAWKTWRGASAASAALRSSGHGCATLPKTCANGEKQTSVWPCSKQSASCAACCGVARSSPADASTPPPIVIRRPLLPPLLSASRASSAACPWPASRFWQLRQAAPGSELASRRGEVSLRLRPTSPSTMRLVGARSPASPSRSLRARRYCGRRL